MARLQKDPLRTLTMQERTQFEKISHSLSLPATQVIHAKELLAVAEGATFSQAAHLAGQESGDTVAHLVSRAGKESLEALHLGHGGGPPILYDTVAQQRILQEFRRTPQRREDGTATWSLKTLQRALQRAPDGFKVGTSTILKVLHEAGYSWQKDRSWCNTGKVIRLSKSGPVEVTDPDTLAKKK